MQFSVKCPGLMMGTKCLWPCTQDVRLSSLLSCFFLAGWWYKHSDGIFCLSYTCTYTQNEKQSFLVTVSCFFSASKKKFKCPALWGAGVDIIVQFRTEAQLHWALVWFSVLESFVLRYYWELTELCFNTFGISEMLPMEAAISTSHFSTVFMQWRRWVTWRMPSVVGAEVQRMED
jgi:hypothetical protein